MKNIRIELREKMHIEYYAVMHNAIRSRISKNHFNKLQRQWVSPMWTDGHIYTPIARFLQLEVL